ncbi:common plant regulatory factor 1-like isoform X1 [Vigna unguiculata]|uniref:common plant regulatory factor 1-like isoform X1 n=1 Tax=Vigna unguiculata TaxID=3917 RepID=UPI0010172176|nr:common plant regulatory factor 1-like isoform X1 [Vigna unguiculata]
MLLGRCSISLAFHLHIVGQLREVSNKVHNAELKLFLEVELGLEKEAYKNGETLPSEDSSVQSTYAPVDGEQLNEFSDANKDQNDVQGTHSHGQGVPSPSTAGTPSSVDSPTKLSGNTDQGLMKKLKGFDGLAMSIGNCNAESAELGAENSLSQSVDTERSSEGSDGNTAGANQTKRKRSREQTSTTDGEGKTETQDGPISKETASSKMIMPATPASIAGKFVGPVISSGFF